MRYARILLLLATAACAMAVATPAPGQAASTAASAHSNSVAAGPKMPHPRLRLDTAQAQIHPQQQPGPVHAEYGIRAQHPPAPQRAPQPSVDAHGRGAYQTRAIEEDQLEIPAFLRRQSS